MSQYTKVADDLKVMAYRFRAIVDVADALERIGSIENAEKEALSRKDAAYTAEGNAQKDLGLMLDKVAKAEEAVEAIKAKAVQIEADARAKAQDILDEANKDVLETVHVASERKTSVEVEVMTLRNQVTSLNTEIKAKNAELGQITQQVEYMKAKIAALR